MSKLLCSEQVWQQCTKTCALVALSCLSHLRSWLPGEQHRKAIAAMSALLLLLWLSLYEYWIAWTCHYYWISEVKPACICWHTEQSQLWLWFRHRLCEFRGSNLWWFFLWMICTLMPSWSGCDCCSRLITVGQSRSQVLHTKGFPFSFLPFYEAATKFHKSPVLNDDCEIHLPQRVPVC